MIRLNDPVKLRRMILWVMLAALGLSAALTVIGVLENSFNDAYRMIGSGIAAVIASALLLAAGKLLDSEKFRKTGLFIMLLILIEFVLVLLTFWDPISNG